MPIYSPTGFLDITNATLRTSNTECQNLKIGTGNLYVTSEISPTYELNLSNVTSLGATSPHTLTLSNVTTAIDITSGNLKIGGLIYTKDWGIRAASGSNDLYVGRFTVHGITEVLITDQGASLGSASKYTITRNVNSTPLVNGIDSSSTINYDWYFKSVDSTTYDLWVRPTAAVQTNIKVTSSTYTELVSEPSSSGAIACVNGLINMSGNVVAPTFSGDGSALTALNATNIASGTLNAARVPTLNQSTTGTAAALTTPISIGGVAFDGSAAITPTTFATATFSGDVTVDADTFHVDTTNDRVGIGTTSPGQKLSIYTGSTNTAALSFDRSSSGNYRTDIYQDSYGADFRVGYGSYTPATVLYLKRMSDGAKRVVIKDRLGIGRDDPSNADLVIKQSGDVNDASQTSGIRMYRAANDTNSWHFGVTGGTNLQFNYNNVQMGYLARSDVGVISFTGQHRNIIKGITPEGINELQGLIVSANTNKYIKLNDKLETGSNAITINESIPVVSLSNVVTDKTCFGVISASEDPEQRSDSYGNFVTPFEKEKGDTRVFINSLGEGAIWVVNTNGSLESGDYITTSNVAGYGQKQESDSLKNYTVAKITMDCDFNPVTQPVQVIKKGEDGENVLDEHGQIQWEDHPTETEKAYKIRYLDADGVETDEANAVHKAAFVGCTYHCG